MNPNYIFAKYFRDYYKFKNVEDARLYLHGYIRAILDSWFTDSDNLKLLDFPYNYFVYRKLSLGRYDIVAHTNFNLNPLTTVQLASLLTNQFVNLEVSPKILSQYTKYLLYATPFDDKNI